MIILNWLRMGSVMVAYWLRLIVCFVNISCGSPQLTEREVSKF